MKSCVVFGSTYVNGPGLSPGASSWSQGRILLRHIDLDLSASYVPGDDSVSKDASYSVWVGSFSDKADNTQYMYGKWKDMEHELLAAAIQYHALNFNKILDRAVLKDIANEIAHLDTMRFRLLKDSESIKL